MPSNVSVSCRKTLPERFSRVTLLCVYKVASAVWSHTTICLLSCTSHICMHRYEYLELHRHEISTLRVNADTDDTKENGISKIWSLFEIQLYLGTNYCIHTS